MLLRRGHRQGTGETFFSFNISFFIAVDVEIYRDLGNALLFMDRDTVVDYPV